MIKLALGVAMALLALIGEAQAGSFNTGSQLYAICTSNALADQSECVGYLEGLVDYMDWDNFVRNKPECIPNGTVGKQLVDVVVNFLRDHPEVRSYDAPGLAARAVSSAWNCK